jgi:SAM-dependent methyltransferase
MHQTDLAILYHHLHHSRHMEDLPFWLDLAKNQGSPLLELGCGAGRIFQPMVLAGIRAVGLDLDPHVLAFLKSSWPAEAGSPSVFQADMAHFHLAARFPLIILPCNTLSTLAQPARLCLLERVSAHLTPGGLFVASLPNPALLARLPARSESEVEELFYSPIDGEPIQVSSAWQRSPDHFTLAWHYDHLLPDGRVERYTMQTRHFLTDTDGYLDELKQMGFVIRAKYGGFDYSQFTSHSPDLIIVAARAS